MGTEDKHASSDHFQRATANGQCDALRALFLHSAGHYPSRPDPHSAAHVSEENGANRRSRFRATPGRDPHTATQTEAMKPLKQAT